MTGDLLVITPSRGRPQHAARLLDAVHKTAKLDTHVYIGVDDDDPALPAYKEMFAEHGHEDVLEVQPRMGLSEWTNHIALLSANDEYPFLASLGDDMVPRTPGWDRALTRAIADMGGTGFSYPFDGTREDVPEAVVVSSDVVAALGWMCEPSLSHWYVDNCWADLGRGAGCIRHLRAVAVDHVHVATGKAPADATARDNGRSLEADRDAYFRWRAERMAGDIKVILALREKALQPA